MFGGGKDLGGGAHYGLWHAANKVTTTTNLATSSPIRLNIFQSSLSLMGKKLLKFASTHWNFETDTGYDKVSLYCFTTSADVQIM